MTRLGDDRFDREEGKKKETYSPTGSGTATGSATGAGAGAAKAMATRARMTKVKVFMVLVLSGGLFLVKAVVSLSWNLGILVILLDGVTMMV